jgi:hypothetical protein
VVGVKIKGEGEKRVGVKVTSVSTDILNLAFAFADDNLISVSKERAVTGRFFCICIYI